MADEQPANKRGRRPRTNEDAAAPAPKRPSKPEGQTRSTVYIDDADWQGLRREAFEQALPINSLIVAAVRNFLASSGQAREAMIAEARRVTAERRA